jgi:hyperosmotically inducible protein
MRRFALLLGLAALAVLGACREEGAAEKAGRKIDEAIDELTDPDEGPLEELGRKTDEALEDAKRAVEEATEGD